MKKAVIVNCFDTYENRVDLIHDFFKNQGYEVTIIQSNFRHFKKIYRESSKENFVFIKSNPYYKNLSFARLYSHYKYAKATFEFVEKIKPDVLYTFIPPNSLGKFAYKYKEKNKDVKLIVDLIDLWPETLPIGNIKKLFPFTSWGSMRDKCIKSSDIVISECDLFTKKLNLTMKGIKADTVYLANKEIVTTNNFQLSEEEIHLAYLGSVNNIIDIPKIKSIIEIIKEIKPVNLHIIGDGENREKLLDAAIAGGAKVNYYGKIYDAQQKQDIFDYCHFGINVMKNNVCVGLTMKSIDYFQHGIPIINNIPEDTANIVNAHSAGINVIDNFDFLKETLNSVNSYENIVEMRKSSLDVFKKYFSEKSFNERMTFLLGDLDLHEK